MIAPNDAAIAPLKPAITRKVTAIAPNNARKHVKHVTIGAENVTNALKIVAMHAKVPAFAANMLAITRRE